MTSNNDYILIDKNILNEWGLINLLADARQYHHIRNFELLQKVYKNKNKQEKNKLYYGYHEEKIKEITNLIEKLQKEFDLK